MDEQTGAQRGAQIDAEKRTSQTAKKTEKPDTNASKLFDATAIKKMESALRGAPLPSKKLTKMEALSELSPELKRQQERGHTAASLTAVLDAGGLRVSERKLAQLLRQHQLSALPV